MGQGGIMEVAVSGANTFIGLRVAEELHTRGHRVIALQHPRRQVPAEHERLAEFCYRLSTVDLRDGGHSVAEVGEAVAGCQAIIHCDLIRRAPRGGVFLQHNPAIFRNLLLAAVRAGGCERIILLSSLSALGPRLESELLTELDEHRPSSDYGRSLSNTEALSQRFRHEFEISIARMPLVYGPGDREALPLFRMVAAGTLYSVVDLQILLSLCHIDDFARGVVDAVLHKDGGGQNFHFASNVKPRLIEIVHAIEDALGSSTRVRHLPRFLGLLASTPLDHLGGFLGVQSGIGSVRLKEYLSGHWACATSNAERVLGWQPTVNFREGIRDTGTWYVERGLLVRRRA